LEKTLTRAHDHAENYTEEMRRSEESSRQKVEKMKAKLMKLEEEMAARKKEEDAGAVVELLRRQLKESHEKNRNLQDYVAHLKESYMATFEATNTSSTFSVQD
jgi:hypothetical protein